MTLRSRLLVGMAAIAIVLTGAAALIIRTTEEHLVDQVDRTLVAAELPRHPGPLRPAQPGPDERPSPLFVAVSDDNGDVVTLYEPRVPGTTLALPAITGHLAIEHAGTGPFTVGSDDGDLRYRALSRRDPRRGLTIVFALPLGDVDDAVRRLVTVSAIATVTVLAVLALVTWWVIRLGVRPIKRMTETAIAIAGGDLSHRVPDVEVGTEAGALGQALNRMMGHIEGAFADRRRSEESLRQFVADASHELRTPITTIRGYAELYRTGGLDEPVELDEAMRRTEQEAVRMGSLVDDLLHLARLDQGRPLEHAPVDLGALVHDAVRDARAVDPDRPIACSIAADSWLEVIGDEARLRQVLANLLTNALVHTDPGAPVSVAARRDGDTVEITVADGGPGMEPDVAARAFERFFRTDASRSRNHGGSGLGLAIVEATVVAHGGSVAIDTAVGDGTTVTVRLPVDGTDVSAR